MNKLKVLDLFSGIGGFSLGLERTGGFETVAFCEIEEFPCKVLARHWPGVPCYHDVSTAQFVEPVDLVTAGFPCQDISIVNQNATGLAGIRSGLFWHILRAICMVGRPRAILENVAEILNRGMGTVLGALASLGYDTQWHCIPASAIGASQERDRCWIIADPSEIRATRLLTSADIGAARQGWKGGAANLSVIADHALKPGDCFPQPLICGMALRVPNRSHRIAALGNAIVPQIATLIGEAILASHN